MGRCPSAGQSYSYAKTHADRNSEADGSGTSIKRSTLSHILKQAHMTVEELNELI
ncbi:hypothetical protein JCM10550A_12810 [Methanogenium cariaci]